MRRSKKAYELYVCPRCFNPVNKCTCELYPPYELIMIDKKLQEPIRLLNQKGYRTWACCEGHKADEEIYIRLLVTDEMMKNKLPNGFWIDKKEFIRCRIPKNCEDIEQFKDNKISELKSWILKLPNNKLQK